MRAWAISPLFRWSKGSGVFFSKKRTLASAFDPASSKACSFCRSTAGALTSAFLTIRCPQIIPMVRQCPEVHFILDHIGKPGIKDHIHEPWRTEIRALSELPNVCCKMSGLVVEADMQNWTREDLKPYIDHVIECFGFDRILFGGDWPVVSQAAELTEWVDALDSALAGCSQQELEKLYRSNAGSFYKLG